MLIGTGFLRNFQPRGHSDVVKAARYGVLDYCAASFAAVTEEGVRRLLHTQRCSGSARLLGQGRTASAEFSALFNGYQAHLLDFDDSHSDVRGHPSAVVLSALLAHITPQNTWENFLDSYILGVETMARLGSLFSGEHYARGWHSTSTIGGIAASAALAYLQGLELEGLRRCCAFAAAQSSGMRNQFGSDAKPLQVGLAAQNASRSLAFTQAGLTAKLDWFAGEQGFLRLYHGAEALEEQQIFADMGREYRIVKPGLWFKKEPFCSAAIPGREAACRIAQQLKKDGRLGSSPEAAIECVDVIFLGNADAALTEYEPRTGYDGKFSIEYIVSLALSGKPLGQESFSSKALDSEVARMMGKVRRRYVAPLGNSLANTPPDRFTEVKVTLKNGMVYQETCRISPYSSQSAKEKDVIAKLASSVGWERAEKLWLSITEKNILEFLALLE